jgi:hypothetical protein
MASSKCSIDGCKRNSDTVCDHCQGQVCTKHYIEHVKLVNDELAPLADELNSIVNAMQEHDPTHDAFEQLEQWRKESHRRIDEWCDKKKLQLKLKVAQKIDEAMKKIRKLSEEVKELIDEGDASFKQIQNIKKSIEVCRKQCQQLEKSDYFRLSIKAINLEATLINTELFTGDGTLLSIEQQIKLNEFYGKEGQTWVLIYKATRDGFFSADFHRCCDSQGPTITVIQSADGGYLFGGYTSASWHSVQAYVCDNNGPFLFTLTNPHGLLPTKYSVVQPKYAICADNNCGPTFGDGHDLYVCTNSQTETGSYFNFPHSYSDTTKLGVLTFTGNKQFRTNDIEIYRLPET